MQKRQCSWWWGRRSPKKVCIARVPRASLVNRGPSSARGPEPMQGPVLTVAANTAYYVRITNEVTVDYREYDASYPLYSLRIVYQ